MKTTCYITISILVLLLNSGANAQIKVTEEENTPALKGVFVHADPRLAILIKKYRNVPFGSIYSGRGYRVQIYSGNNRNRAMELKIDFLKRFPGVRTYLTYVQPQFRVKVGDFHNRADAQKMYDQLSTLYNPCMIVPDIVVINNFKDD